jgi:hypothetical protein
MHSNDKHYFAFFISNIEQIQFTQVQQESKFAEFIMTKLIYRTFDSLSSFADSESFLLHSTDLFHLFVLVFYMNDFFDEFQNFDDLYEFLRDHFLSRIEWVKLRLFFKKMYLFENKMKALKLFIVLTISSKYWRIESKRLRNDSFLQIKLTYESLWKQSKLSNDEYEISLS